MSNEVSTIRVPGQPSSVPYSDWVELGVHEDYNRVQV